MNRSKIARGLQFLCFFFLLSSTYVKGADLPFGFKEKLIAEKLDSTFIANFGDKVYFTEKSGLVHVAISGVLESTPVLDIRSLVDNGNERGLQSIALDPDFGTNGYLYAYYCALGENRNRVSRFEVVSDFADIESEIVIVELDLLAGDIHNGGAMLFSGGHLYVATGDASNPEASSKLTYTHGKVLRFNPDGSIPNDNPFYSSTTGIYRAIYALGFRNPYGMKVQPGTEKILINEVGFKEWEEINELVAGGDYGWPNIEGKIKSGQVEPSGYQDPVFTYFHQSGFCAITGNTFYNPTTAQFPTKYVGKYIFGDYCTGVIRLFDPVEKEVTDTFITGTAQPVAFAVDESGRFYYMTRATPDKSPAEQTQSCCGELFMVEYTGDGEPAFAYQPKDVLAVAGETVSFSVRPTGSGPFTYQWRKNGNKIDGATDRVYKRKSVKVSDNGAIFTCVLKNSLGSVTSDPAELTVVENRHLKAVITTPVKGTKYNAGTTLSFAGLGEDDTGELAASTLTWEIVFHHDYHTHPAMPPLSGTKTGTYDLASNHEPDLDVFYRIYLTVKDSRGITDTTYTDIHPNLVKVTLATIPSGLVLEIDHLKVLTPYTFTATVGISRSVGALTQTIEAKVYEFDSWSNGADAEDHFVMPSTPTTYTATFTQTGVTPNGVNYNYYEGDWVTIPDFSALTAKESGTVNTIDTANQDRNYEFAFEFTSYLYITKEEVYTFYLSSQDGSKLYINDLERIDNDGIHAFTEKQFSISLREGSHHIKVSHFVKTAVTQELTLEYSSPSISRQEIPQSVFYSEDPYPCISQILAFRVPPAKEYYTNDDYFYILGQTFSYQPLDYEVEGPGTLSFDTERRLYKVDITGSGTITVYVRQPGNALYCPAPTLVAEVVIHQSAPLALILGILIPLVLILGFGGYRVHKKKGFKNAFCPKKKQVMDDEIPPQQNSSPEVAKKKHEDLPEVAKKKHEDFSVPVQKKHEDFSIPVQKKHEDLPNERALQPKPSQEEFLISEEPKNQVEERNEVNEASKEQESSVLHLSELHQNEKSKELFEEDV